nr:MAG TPA: hypothetical protein [Caudoviricetes sp.]
MAYNSSHTGAQIDDAVGKVIEKEATWDGKQNKLTPGTDYATPEQVNALKVKAHKVSLTVAGWNSSTKQQTVAVADVVADETAQLILPMPAAASMTAYNDAGIQCTAQAAGKLTFTADTVPTVAIDVYVTITPVSFS